MPISLKPLEHQTLVITGASSGIGRATALSAARQGAKVVLAARNEAALRTLEERIRQHRGRARVFVADVGNRDDVEGLAAFAIREFGGFDTWVNNAGVAMFGAIEDLDESDGRKLFDTNFWGTVHGSQAAVRHLRLGGGALINVGSVLGDFGVPLQGMYAASKHAVKGFTDSLRMELEAENAPVSVTLIKPASVATPIVDQLKNDTGREPRLPPPYYAPEEVALAILYAAANPRRDIYVGGAGRLMSLLASAAPDLADRLAARFVPDAELGDPEPDREGNLYKPSKDGEVRGSRVAGRPSSYTRASLHPLSPESLATNAAVAVLDTALSFFARRRT